MLHYAKHLTTKTEKKSNPTSRNHPIPKPDMYNSNEGWDTANVLKEEGITEKGVTLPKRIPRFWDPSDLEGSLTTVVRRGKSARRRRIASLRSKRAFQCIQEILKSIGWDWKDIMGIPE